MTLRGFLRPASARRRPDQAPALVPRRRDGADLGRRRQRAEHGVQHRALPPQRDHARHDHRRAARGDVGGTCASSSAWRPCAPCSPTHASPSRWRWPRPSSRGSWWWRAASPWAAGGAPATWRSQAIGANAVLAIAAFALTPAVREASLEGVMRAVDTVVLPPLQRDYLLAHPGLIRWGVALQARRRRPGRAGAGRAGAHPRPHQDLLRGGGAGSRRPRRAVTTIRLLSEDLANQIAAGEVVERPGQRGQGAGRERARRRRQAHPRRRRDRRHRAGPGRRRRRRHGARGRPDGRPPPRHQQDRPARGPGRHPIVRLPRRGPSPASPR